MKVILVLKNGDFTEGAGPMLAHKIFSNMEKAEAYIAKQPGIFGTDQYRYRVKELDSNGNPFYSYMYNGYSIKEMGG